MNIEKRSLDRQAADWLRSAIIDGRFNPGARLTETSLAAEIGLSRSTVRTALQRLAGEGLVVQRPYSGWEIFPLSKRDAAELYSLRALFEGMAAKLAAENINEAGKSELKQSLDELRRAIKKRDRRGTAEADLALHKTIIRLSGHARLATHSDTLNQSTLIYVMSTNLRVANDAELLESHTVLIDAIISGNAELAEKIAHNHVLHAQASILESLSGKEASAPDPDQTKRALHVAV